MKKGRIENIILILACCFVFLPVSVFADTTDNPDVTLILRDGSVITKAMTDQPPPPVDADISVKDRFVKWKSINIEGFTYVDDHKKYKVDFNQMKLQFMSIELVDTKLRPFQNGRLIIEKRSGGKMTIADGTLLTYFGHPDGVSDILAIEFDSFNRFWRDIFIDIRDVRKIVFGSETQGNPEPDQKVSQFASSSGEIVRALNTIDANRTPDGSVNLNIEFDYNSYKIRPSSVPLLNELGKALHSADLMDKSILIKGHTDSDGPADYNQVLSLNRARAVRTYLVSKFGISPAKLATAGYGESIPLVPNTTPENKQINRRVEIRRTNS
ncbi:MAG: OmpA family protein [Proteobacteria bacterium]|nr:OmpA family protein [Pseudomonadota bacterium]